MKEQITVVLAFLLIVLAFGFAGYVDYQDELDRQARAMSRCMPDQGEVAMIAWQNGRRVCTKLNDVSDTGHKEVM